MQQCSQHAARGARAGLQSWLALPLNGANEVRWDQAGAALDERAQESPSALVFSTLQRRGAQLDSADPELSLRLIKENGF